MAEVIARYVHFLGIFVMASMLAGEFMALRSRLTPDAIRRLAVIDAVYGVSAVLTLLAGLSLWLWVGKPAAFYTGNPLFQVKLGVFLFVALLSVYPTVFFLKHRNAPAAVLEVPATVIRIVQVELLALVCMPLLAVTMARGYGLP